MTCLPPDWVFIEDFFSNRTKLDRGMLLRLTGMPSQRRTACTDMPSCDTSSEFVII